MSYTSRKRKNRINQEKEGNLSKRARLLSSLWNSQEEAAHSIETSSSTSSSSVYRIKAIIGERLGEYLIDWADDLISGEKYKADWVRKTTNPRIPYVQKALCANTTTQYHCGMR